MTMRNTGIFLAILAILAVSAGGARAGAELSSGEQAAVMGGTLHVFCVDYGDCHARFYNGADDKNEAYCVACNGTGDEMMCRGPETDLTCTPKSGDPDCGQRVGGQVHNPPWGMTTCEPSSGAPPIGGRCQRRLCENN